MEKQKEKKVPTFPIADWFTEITGCNEELFKEKRQELITADENQSLIITNLKTKQQFCGGSFEVISIRDLIFSTFKFHPLLKRKSLFGGTPKEPSFNEYIPLEIITREDDDPTKEVDVAYLQSLEENRECTFQVASNFNGIEAISETVVPNSPDFTTKYYKDRTQGPAASISAGAAAILRVHAPYMNANNPPETWGQDKDTQINLMQNLGSYYPIKNGYVILSNAVKKFPKYLSSKYKRLLLKGCIGLHSSVQVTSGHRDRNEMVERVDDPEQLIDQVLCAAVNISQGTSGIKNFAAPSSEHKCRLALDIAYHGAYLSALRNGRKKCFLTLIGGGAFGNPKSWIYDSILSAHRMWGGKGALASLEKVVLVIFSPCDELANYVEIFKNVGIPVTLKKTSKTED